MKNILCLNLIDEVKIKSGVHIVGKKWSLDR